MLSLRRVIKEAEAKKVAIGHFNVSNLEQFKAVWETAKKLNVPVVIGFSEGELEFMGVSQAVALVENLREKGVQLYLNADHTHALDKVKEAAEAGFDSVVFDPTPNFVGRGASASEILEENIRLTKEAVKIVKSINPRIVVEGELGYIGSGSEVRKEIPRGASIQPEDLTKPEEAARFVKETSVDLLAPAVGNIHGMFALAPNPRLDIARIKAIREAAGVPLVLHGGSGIADEDFVAAIQAGISLIHISTELRVAWREGMESIFHERPGEVAPYKISEAAILKMKEVVEKKLRLFSAST